MQNVDIYAINAPETDCTRFISLMSAVRLEKLSRSIGIEAKRLSAAAEMMLNVALNNHTDNYKPCPDYFYDELGKPTLAPSYGRHISLSHSGELALCAISALPVGLDAEKHRPVHDGLKYRILSESELAYCTSPNMLIDLWSAKESCLKLTGKGLRTPMKHLSLDDYSLTENGVDSAQMLDADGRRIAYTKKIACGDLPYGIFVSTFEPANAVLHICTEADLLCVIRAFYQNTP